MPAPGPRLRTIWTAALVAAAGLAWGCQPRFDPFAAYRGGQRANPPETITGPSEDTIYVELKPVVVNPNVERRVVGGNVFLVPKAGPRRPPKLHLGYFVDLTPYNDYEAFEAALRRAVEDRRAKSRREPRAVLVWDGRVNPEVIARVRRSISAAGVEHIQGVSKSRARGLGLDGMRR
jgi:hypothetical protein